MSDRLRQFPRGTGSVIVVEDSRDMLTFFTTMLEATGYTIAGTAHNGQDALDLLNSLTTLPDLIISDYTMPGTSGIELLQQLQASDMYRDIPFILTSSMSYKRQIRYALERADVDLSQEYVLQLPVLPEVFLQKVADCMARQSSDAS